MGKNEKCCDDGGCCGSSGCCCGGKKGCGCECGQTGGFERQYRTRAEQIEDLEAYLEELKLEVQAVEEHLSDLKRKR